MEDELRKEVYRITDERGIRHSHLAKRMHLTTQTFSNKLRGRSHYTIPELEFLSMELGISIDGLMKKNGAA